VARYKELKRARLKLPTESARTKDRNREQGTESYRQKTMGTESSLKPSGEQTPGSKTDVPIPMLVSCIERRFPFRPSGRLFWKGREDLAVLGK